PHTARVVELHGLSQQRDNPTRAGDFLGLHLHLGKSSLRKQRVSQPRHRESINERCDFGCGAWLLEKSGRAS
ncbi:MAG: hypothetical protein ACLQFI_15905, partial [Methylocella sp.]